MAKKLKIGILGSGNIGTDLLMKVLKSDDLECKMFAGRNLGSLGMKRAFDLGIKVSDRGIEAFQKHPEKFDLVFDATSASAHKSHALIFEELGIRAVDMTPSQVGDLCVPEINMKECLKSKNLNMITCGGQASIPVAHLFKENIKNVDYIEVVSAISSRSAGPGTRANIDDYIQNTEQGLRYFTGCENVKAILNLNPANPCIDMQTTIYAKTDECDVGLLRDKMVKLEQNMQRYVPGYKVVVPPVFEDGRVMTMVRVRGLGDYLPKYAGNLDIINCAAIAMATEFAKKG